MGPAGKPRILVVDDDRSNLRTFEIVFRGEYEATSAGSGDDALRALAGAPYDVALVDYAMPEMNGIELLGRLRTSHPDTRRVIVTGYADLPDIADAARSGLADAVVLKPWDRDSLKRTIDALVPPSRARGATAGVA